MFDTKKKVYISAPQTFCIYVHFMISKMYILFC
jgi:hypothetical protein